MRHVGPTFDIYITNDKQIFNRKFLFFLFYFFFSSLASLFDLRKSDRQNSSSQEAKCSTQRGLRVGIKNTGFHRVFN